MELWSHPVDDLLGGVIGLPVGETGRDGGLVLDSETEATAVSRIVRRTFTALDGAGEVLWSTAVEGVIAELPPAGYFHPSFDGRGVDHLTGRLVFGVRPPSRLATARQV